MKYVGKRMGLKVHVFRSFDSKELCLILKIGALVPAGITEQFSSSELLQPQTPPSPWPAASYTADDSQLTREIRTTHLTIIPFHRSDEG